MSWVIREEREDDEAAIHSLTAKAFAPMPFSDGSEPAIIDGLRKSGDLALSLVAEDEHRIVGHIAFSPVAISDCSQEWYGLGPVSVALDCQRKGLGSALIERGIADMRAAGARGIVLLGSTEYYPRFGFERDPKLQYPGPPAENFMRLILQGDVPAGTVSYAAAFG
ncbi:GNAT family N-acetyltransferase [Aurantiacibacter sediminis]|uniref:N-acetyltransferase n=1 Tax=Aurantiacibacter sediminis TaxID=2793064 RepID=A0ABS0MZR1_9SPHN|nr:N-acetyltransferase [Aurantiacibacter sediminis]MBH5321201.1 N-acetyltransferase [Aurantiacibacter sediminis]